MAFRYIETYVPVPESYSRELDERVAFEEMPYGYVLPPLPADSGNFDQYSLESHVQYPPHRRMK